MVVFLSSDYYNYSYFWMWLGFVVFFSRARSVLNKREVGDIEERCIGKCFCNE